MRKINLIVNDCSPVVALTDSQLSIFRITAANLVRLGDRDNEKWPSELDLARLSGSSANQLEEPVGESDLAFLQYTSGTTGNPKGGMRISCSVHRLLRSDLTVSDDLTWSACERSLSHLYLSRY